MAPLISHHRGCKTVSKAKLQKAFSALLMSQEPGVLYARLRDPSFELERSEFSSTHGGVIELVSPQDGSAPGNIQEGTHREWLVPQEWIRSHPMLTVVVLYLLLLLIVALVPALVAVSVKTPRGTPVTPFTALTSDTVLLLACPKGWIGYDGVCYYLSKDHHSWDEAQALCSELGASLAMPKDMDMMFLSCFSGNINHWLGLRRQDQGLQWVDGSSFSSSVNVLGNGECVFLVNDKFWSGICSNSRPYLCSKPKVPCNREERRDLLHTGQAELYPFPQHGDVQRVPGADPQGPLSA